MNFCKLTVFERKICMFSISERIQDLSVGVEKAWTQRHFSAKVDNIGNESFFIHHQTVALSLIGMGKRLLCSWTS